MLKSGFESRPLAQENSLLMTTMLPFGGWVLLVMGTGSCDEKSEFIEGAVSRHAGELQK